MKLIPTLVYRDWQTSEIIKMMIFLIVSFVFKLTTYPNKKTSSKDMYSPK